MLSGLFIQNIAVIERASMDFHQGFTVMTGETGAGKSIIIDAIGAALGERISKELIRTGSNSASVTALFSDLNQELRKTLAKLDIPIEDDELQIYRDVKNNGKSVCKMNGIPVTVAMLKEVGVQLIGIHGQHDSYELLSPEIHGRYLDNYGGLAPLLAEYRGKYNRLKEIKRELDQLNVDEAQKERRIDLLQYQIEEIEAAEIMPGERELLSKRRNFIRNSENVARCVLAAKAILNGDEELDGAISEITSAAEYVEQAAENLDSLLPSAQKLRDIEYLLQDINGEIRTAGDEIEFSQEEKEEIELRLDQL
ncbi:MAG: AAA family ATPase, partial [Oscillospiraceae bacterium]